MASLIEELIDTLEMENREYEELLAISKEKTNVIISGDIERLKEMVAMEQERTDKLASLEQKRIINVSDIATVLSKDVEALTIKNIIELLKGQEKEQKRLAVIHDKLQITLNDMVVINEINKELINDSLELIEFNINYINGIYQMPETANYNKNAYNAGTYGRATFDAKQ